MCSKDLPSRHVAKARGVKSIRCRGSSAEVETVLMRLGLNLNLYFLWQSSPNTDSNGTARSSTGRAGSVHRRVRHSSFDGNSPTLMQSSPSCAAANRLSRIFSMRRKEALRAANITHVLSVLRLDVDDNLFSSYHHKVVQVDDTDDENLLEHFPATNDFIQDGLHSGGGVLVHWWVQHFFFLL